MLTYTRACSRYFCPFETDLSDKHETLDLEPPLLRDYNAVETQHTQEKIVEAPLSNPDFPVRYCAEIDPHARLDNFFLFLFAGGFNIKEVLPT